MKMKKWMSAALIVSLVAANNQAMGNVKAFISSDYVKSQVSVFDEQNGSITVTPTPIPTPTATPKILGGYAVTYINEGETTTEGWYPAGRTTTITLIEPEPKEGYVFVGWKDYKENIYQPGEEVGVSDVPSATFIAVWEQVEEIMPTPCALYSILYVDGEYRNTCWDTVLNGRADFTIIEPNPKDGYVFAGWQNGNKLYQPGESVSLWDLSSTEFTAVWLELQETATPGAITTITPPTVTPTMTPTVTLTMTPSPAPTMTPTATPAVTLTMTPSPTPTMAPTAMPTVTPTMTPSPASTMTPTATPDVTPTIKPTAIPVTKKAKVKITTNAKKKFIVGKKYTIKAKRTNTSKKLTWSVSNKKYATINKNTGVLKTKKAGKVTITVTCGKVKDKIKIVIKKK